MHAKQPSKIQSESMTNPKHRLTVTMKWTGWRCGAY